MWYNIDYIMSIGKVIVMLNRLIETVMGAVWPLVKRSLLGGLVAFVMSASALEMPEFISTNNVTELRYREWGAVNGPVQTVKIEFAIRRVEFFWYRKLLSALNRIGGSFGADKFGVRTIYDAVRERAEEEPDSEKRKKLLELLEEIEKGTNERMSL